MGSKSDKAVPVPDLSGPVRYPNIVVDLCGGDGNAFAILGKVIRAMQRAGVEQRELDAFKSQATGGDYDTLLQTCMRWVDCR